MACCDNSNIADVTYRNDVNCSQIDLVEQTSQNNEVDAFSTRRRYLCCDCTGICGYYREEDRDPFWPAFCHPRQLTCAQLYNQGALRRRQERFGDRDPFDNRDRRFDEDDRDYARRGGRNQNRQRCRFCR